MRYVISLDDQWIRQEGMSIWIVADQSEATVYDTLADVCRWTQVVALAFRDSFAWPKAI